MSLITDIGIPAALGAMVIVVLFLFKGLLSFVMGVPLWLIFSFVVAAGTIAFIPTNIVLGFYKGGKEGFTFMQARKQGIPVICDVEIGTGNAEFVLGKKVNPKDPLFEDEESGVKADPSLISAYAEPLRFSGGLMVIGYGHHNWLPQTHRNHLAFKAIVEYFRTEPMKELLYLTDNEKIELISKSEHFLAKDLETKIGKYFKKRTENEKIIYFREFQKLDEKTGEMKWYQQEINVQDSIALIQKAKADITKLPIATGYYSMKEAFVYNNVPYSAQHLSQLKNLLKQLSDLDWQKKIDLWTYGVIIVAVMGMTILGIYILEKVVFK